MNRLITTDSGGFPLQLDDLRWVDESVRNAIHGFLSAYGILPTDSFILSGCEVTDGGTVWDIAAGYISLQGEVLEVTAHSIGPKVPVPGDALIWRVATANDPAGLKTFQSTLSYNTYQIRQAEVVVQTTSSGYMPMLAPSLMSRIVSKMSTADKDNIGLGMTATTANWIAAVMGSTGIEDLLGAMGFPYGGDGNSAGKLVHRVWQIGAWDMTTFYGKTTQLPGCNVGQIVNVQVIIKNTANTVRAPLNNGSDNSIDSSILPSGGFTINDGSPPTCEMIMQPPPTSIAGNTAYAGPSMFGLYSGSGNRGYIMTLEEW